MNSPALPASKAVATLLALMLVAILPGCVKQSEYEALQQENQQLQKRLDQATEQARQAQAELSVQQIRVFQLMEVETKLQKTQEQLLQTQDELDAMKAEFEKFRTQRRSAMLGKKYPVLHLDNGKMLREAEITAIVGEELSIKHEDGFLKVALAATSDDLRWEACYDPREARMSARDQLLAEARRIEAGKLRGTTQSRMSATAPSSPTTSVVGTLRQQLVAQRRQLNTDYQALAAKNSSALQGAAVWDSARPEASPLLNSLSGSRAVLGISRLQSQRDAILMTLQQLRSLDPAAR
ncbi:hypothetical protein [Prosthecobacter sp.]|uniref:hypothetical protein n=1 Tax=Prosthecobacter sp. TaxID=1965333 RepID=UPI002AB80F0C|nr:hypothetical protein [Prosthecobacter sp.]MDZ4401464.1 hypothetical protein [Prosthecobacter sp.]